jgi:hypothetical protein
MPREIRNAKRIPRDVRTGRLNTRNTEYFLIVTDAKQTEQNYIKGFQKSLPQNAQHRISIKVCQENSQNKLIGECKRLANIDPKYQRHIWILLDRDEVPVFDKIITEAKKNDINVAWSNPCIEIWFSAYFENIKTHTSAEQATDAFKELFKQMTNIPYRKNDDEIYKRLTQFGDETKAIMRAEQKRKEHNSAGIKKPSIMVPATTVDELISEMRNVVDDK